MKENAGVRAARATACRPAPPGATSRQGAGHHVRLAARNEFSSRGTARSTRSAKFEGTFRGSTGSQEPLRPGARGAGGVHVSSPCQAERRAPQEETLAVTIGCRKSPSTGLRADAQRIRRWRASARARDRAAVLKEIRSGWGFLVTSARLPDARPLGGDALGRGRQRIPPRRRRLAAHRVMYVLDDRRSAAPARHRKLSTRSARCADSVIRDRGRADERRSRRVE